MTQQRIRELRRRTLPHIGKTKSAAIITECLDELERVQHLYCLALDYGWSGYRGRAVALSKLKELVKKG